MKTVLETIQAGGEYFDRNGVESGRLTMELLTAHVLECSRMELYVEWDRPMYEKELVPLRELTKRRLSGEPLQHIIGTVAFCSRDFICDGRGLIPRPETEELVELLKDRWKDSDTPERILDMGTGSGVIGLTLACDRESALVTMVDVSEEALGLARENAERIEAPMDRLTFSGGDLFSELSGERFDLIVANLPYIASAEITDLSVEVQRDPKLALDGGASGTELMERFVADAGAHANDGCVIAMEVGAGQPEKIRDLLLASDWTEGEILADLSGIERFVLAQR